MNQAPRILFRRPYSRFAPLDRFAHSYGVRAGVRAAAVAFLFTTLAYGLIVGGHLGAGSKASQFAQGLSRVLGLSAQHIAIGGLMRETPQTVLSAIGVEAGGSLIGFSAENAEMRLKNIDWVADATVRRIFPNRLEIKVTERVPFAIWQRGGKYYLIDETGAAMSADPRPYAGKLLLVTGEGAQLAVGGLVNQLESNVALKSRLVAAGRVGGRRWNLHFPNGVKAQLPENGVEAALSRLERLEVEQGILERGIVSVDLRLPDRVVVVPLKQQGSVPSSLADVKVSRQ
ncbi:MAG: FtsQ-type POTRA domain-containing protein [Aestuariivirgaceae bacterium]|nr:FtsQ-type POTRA domain-containing protein [Aestuariivirgaceae bacterium]